MDDAVPIIYARSPQRQALAVSGRLLALGIALGCLVPLLMAAKLRPSPGSEQKVPATIYINIVDSAA